MAFKLNPNAFKRAPLPAPKVLTPEDRETRAVIESEVLMADGAIAAADSVIDGVHEPVVKDATEENLSGDKKLSSLIDDDFPFDETQLVAIEGIVREKYACMTGAAGTGKTTTTKKIVDRLQDSLARVDMSTYWKKGSTAADAEDDYEVPEDLIPSIALVSFTGRATQMIKKNFPRDWHGNIMTIHRLLGFVPEFYDDFDPETQSVRKKMRFIPTYNAETLMPWDVIVIDETGMLGLDLWHQLWAACKPDCRIIMIGDINQLPPTHGKSVFGFALSEWPSWELTHVHRQQGANNSIVDNAHRILNGVRPISDCPDKLANLKTQDGTIRALNFMAKNKDWRFVMFEVDEDSRKASLRIRQVMKLLQGRIYEPNRDAIITPINGFESTATGYMLGQEPMNRELAITLNAGQDRYLIDGGRDRKNFAIGDKVMATRNDYEAGITNGMTGIIESIAEHGGYQGDARRWGRIADVQEYINSIEEDYSEDDFSLEELAATHDEQAEGAEAAKEGKDRGPSSHIVTVRFGEGEHSFTISFQSLAEVASLMTAYVVTCHKMQGGEAPLVAWICHQAHKRPLNREWGYTAQTRGSQRVILFYTKQGLGFMLTKQNIKGTNLAAKVASFQALQRVGIAGASVKVKLPKANNLSGDLVVRGSSFPVANRTNALSTLVAKATKQEEKPRQIKPEIHIHLHRHELHAENVHVTQAEQKPSEPINMGDLNPQQDSAKEMQLRAITERMNRIRIEEAEKKGIPIKNLIPQHALPAPKKDIIPVGPIVTLEQAARPAPLQLTYQPAPVKTPIPKMTSLAQLIARQKKGI